MKERRMRDFHAADTIVKSTIEDQIANETLQIKFYSLQMY